MSSTKTIRVSEKVIAFLQEKLKPLSGSSASDVLEKELGLDGSDEELQKFWVIKSENVQQILAFENPHKALEFGQKQIAAGQMAKIIAVKEVKPS